MHVSEAHALRGELVEIRSLRPKPIRSEISKAPIVNEDNDEVKRCRLREPRSEEQ
jgi:hypothetical protein